MKSIILFYSVLFVLLCQNGNADNRSDQMNPNNDAYWESRGYDERPDDWEDSDDSSTYDDNRSNQLNPNNDAYWQSRGYAEKPDDWDDEDIYDDDQQSQISNILDSDKTWQSSRKPKETSIASWFLREDFPWLKWPAVLILMLLTGLSNWYVENKNRDKNFGSDGEKQR